ncbi:hypothetical protein HN51_059550 [Arachis hypogaea]|uniref:Protein GLUTAMINE DUMPER n=2 Tax=Arachis hypogaea TaxID=3818 RepID=A0A444X663_ARAHY|nr:protein GLUTAMINE DUMPER 5 [Arachis ipaensis]XP_025683955.1 protein GLUTAMINE DUMPER 5 [Arachis hypogaea]QHN82980.1 Protein GLUTAMINE DUMPER [Arachis hypogaea]RYQ85162.1 hypothetical protein Ahy_B10g104654 isoform B [Arachis hypogaea]
MRSISSTAPTTTPSSSSLSSTSTWHSPVPYLFGGLAAMLGLIAFALFILACSFWKLTAIQSNDHEEEEQERSMERNLATKEADEGTNKEQVKPYEDKILVIMAGHDKPTFLATPTSAKCSSSPNQGPATNNNSAKHILNEDKTQKEIMDNNAEHQQHRPQTQQSQ